MKYGVLLIMIGMASCQLETRMNRLDSGRKKADAVIAAIGDSALIAKLPGDSERKHAGLFYRSLASQCNWGKKRGKFVDFYMHEEENHHAVSYIYEYFLDCDSIRLTLVYDTNQDSVSLISAHLEPLETKNPWLIDPMKSIHKDKDWERHKQAEKNGN
jgi:hypothetical protein